ncbi:MAG: hypothetical protein J6S10_02480, partial [Clostridia bacterium]|nr:hypothetical protein [Clostridia bacterium]
SLQNVRVEHTAMLQDFRLANARIKALGGITDSYTDRESFNELEREYNAFTQLYKQQWKKTKKDIKKQHLSVDNLRVKKQNNGKEASESLKPTDKNDA